MFIKIVIMIYRCPATSTTPGIKKLSVRIAFGRSGEKVTRLLIVKKSKKIFFKKEKKKEERNECHQHCFLPQNAHVRASLIVTNGILTEHPAGCICRMEERICYPSQLQPDLSKGC